MPKRSDAAEYVAPAIEVLPKPTCNMSSRPSLSTSCASLPGWTVRRWPRLVVPTSQPYNSRPDEFATSVNLCTSGLRSIQGSLASGPRNLSAAYRPDRTPFSRRSLPGFDPEQDAASNSDACREDDS